MMITMAITGYQGYGWPRQNRIICGLLHIGAMIVVFTGSMQAIGAFRLASMAALITAMVMMGMVFMAEDGLETGSIITPL